MPSFNALLAVGISASLVVAAPSWSGNDWSQGGQGSQNYNVKPDCTTKSTSLICPSGCATTSVSTSTSTMTATITKTATVTATITATSVSVSTSTIKTCSSSSSSSSSTKTSSTTSTISTPIIVVKPVSTSSTTALSTSSPPASTTVATSTTVAPQTTPAVTTTSQQSTTSSAPGACITTPELGTYCGFINPEDPCAPQPGGNGPVPSPDTVSAFLAYPQFHAQASAAPKSIASSANGVTYAQTFSDLSASVSTTRYLGSHLLPSYDAAGCAAYCDNTTSCIGFNLFVERDPSQNPTNNDSTAPTVWGYYCPNPASITNYQCTLWGSFVGPDTAVNTGGWRKDFNVVIAGSIGYAQMAA